MKFRSASYWDLEATLRADDKAFTATLVRVAGDRVATGKDFDSHGQLVSTGRIVHIRSQQEAGALREGLMRRLPWTVTSVEEKPFTQRPAPPFTTSTLQQEANRKLRFTARRTMEVAQRLYENGLITYMRTDSTNLSTQAVSAARELIASRYGNE